MQFQRLFRASKLVCNSRNIVPVGLCRGQWRRICTHTTHNQEAHHCSTPVLKHLTSKIRSTGPISVAEYMREVLTNPVSGYYVHNDMLGAEGDFITSPEISQIFGELLGIWCVSEWMAAGKPNEFQLVEFGPGRGSLTSDVLRVLKQLKSVVGESAVSVHLVEVSPKLSEVQAQSLTGEDSKAADNENDPVYRRGTTKTGHPVYWYRGMEDVPRGFSIYLAHEFFDALPIHKFQKTDKGWREILIDIDPQVANKLRFVLAPSATLASSTLLQADEEREHVEVCPEGGVLVQRLTNRISEDGGAVLIADYGHAGDKTDTFRGFRGHKLHNVLVAPGTADLTADVDFRYLKRMTDERVLSFGPIAQQQFLRNMGIDVRLQVLLRSCTDSSTRKQLVQGFDMMMNPEKMGERFKFFALVPHCRIAIQTRGKKTEQKGGAAPPVSGFSELGL